MKKYKGIRLAKKVDEVTIEFLLKKAEEYKTWHRDGKSQDPFASNNAYWAAGLEFFLIWLKEQV